VGDGRTGNRHRRSCACRTRSHLAAAETKGDIAGRKGGEEAAAVLANSKRQWQRTLASNALDDPNAHFDNLSEDEFLARLQSAADEYHFRVVETQWLQPLQVAPLVVVRTDDPASLSHDAAAVLRLLDPQAPVGEDWEGWAFEGFFFEARDQNGSPFFAAFNHWRGSDRGGGQWARSENLYPFPHGLMAETEDP
jgi:hypothetical protein